MTRRTLVFSNYDDLKNPYYGGGGALAIHEIAKRLATRHAVSVVTGRYPGAAEAMVDGVQYTRIGPERAGPQLGQLIFQFSLCRQVKRRPFDMWVESLTPPLSTACLPLFTRKPVVALTQVMAGRAMSRKYKLPFFLAERWGLKCYRHAIALSEFLRSEITRANPLAQVAVIPNGVPAELVRQPVQQSERHWLFLGRLDIAQKGIDLLLNSLAALGDRLAWPVVIAGAGSGSAEAWIDRRIQGLNLSGKVQRIGRVVGPQKHRVLSESALLVLPSRFEASPVVVAEAWCYGLPVVLFGIPELTELPDDCCVKVKPFDHVQYAEALCTLGADAPRRRAMGTAAKERTQALDWDLLAEQYEQFFRGILENPL